MKGAQWGGWTALQLCTLGLLAAAAIWATLPGWLDIWSIATRKQDASYILLAPAVTLYLFWLRRSRLRFVRYRPSLLGPLAAILALALTLYGEEVDNHLAVHAGSVLALCAAVVTLTGWPAIQQFGAVFLSLAFLIPVPGAIRQEIARPLQLLAASVTEGVLGLLGIDVWREGAVLVIRGAPVAVGEACDGMRMVFALVLVVFTFVASVPFRWGARALILAASPLIALVCNVARLVPTGIAYGYADTELAERVHDIAGWLMLPFALLLLFLLVRTLKWLDLPVYRWRMIPS